MGEESRVNFFIVTITLRKKKVKLVVIEFIDYAIIW
jgi:hypothetical protein